MMKNKTNNRSSSFKKPRGQKMADLSKQDTFLFNKTPILASALQKLKKNEYNKKSKSQSKGPVQMINKAVNNDNEKQQIDMLSKPSKKVKKSSGQGSSLPSFAYIPLQKDLYSFYHINKISLKTIESVPEPVFQVGSVLLAAICDRGIGGKYLVVNLFRNKKGYIDYKQVSQTFNRKEDFTGIESYHEPGDYVICTVVKSINANHIQLSLNKFIELDSKFFRVGQVVPAQIRSKEQLGCHLSVYGCKDYKFFLPKIQIDQQLFQSLTQNTQIIVTICDIDSQKHLIKVKLTSQQHGGFNLRGIQEQEMSKMNLEQYVSPGTLLNTKIVKILKNGVMVKFLKIFIGFIHVDHLNNSLNYYSVDGKIQGRIIYSCLNPPFLYLSQRHTNLYKYSPKRPLYSPVPKPQNLEQLQGSYLSKQQQFFIHPTQLHSQIDNISKFWVKENNYFERYQIMGSRKLGLRVGEVAKEIPFNNFKVFGDGKGDVKEGKFKVMCLDVWNKVVKVTYDEKFMKANNMIYDVENIDMNKQYCGIIKVVNQNGMTIQFCNNVRGILPKNEIKMQQIQSPQTSLGKSIQVYITAIKAKKNFLTLSLVPPQMRRNSSNKPGNKKLTHDNQENQVGNSSMKGTVISVDQHSIYPIYVRTRGNRLVKISIFGGIRPASVDNLAVVTQLQKYFKKNDEVIVHRKGKQFFLYPPQQLCDKSLKICRVVGQKGPNLRVQIAKSEFKNCHISDITDIITPFPFAGINIGEYKIGRILSNGMVCLRDSIVMNGIPKSVLDYKMKYSEDQKRGDFRNKIATVGSVGLEENNVLFGYIKSFSEKGCFVSLSSDYQVRIEMCQLTDDYITDKAKFYHQNKLILCRLISKKVKPNEPSKFLFDASSRQSIIKMGYPINQEALMVGLTVSGKVSGYTKGKALIKLDGSKFTGIMHPNQVQGIDKSEPIETSMKLGTHYTMKIIQYSNEGKRLIRLSTLQKYFNKYKGVQLGEQPDQNAIMLWENYQQFLQQEPPAKTINIEIGEKQQDQEDQYNRIKNLLNDQLGNQEEENEFEQGQDKNDQVQQDQQEQQGQQDSQENQEQQMIDQNQSSRANKKSFNNTQQNVSKQQLAKRLSQFRSMNNSSQIYQSIILANDSSQSHLQYISSMVSNPSVTPQQIRQQFAKSISMLQTIKQKENMWIAWLNMELILGDFMGVVTKAVGSDAGIAVFNRVVEILRDQGKWDLAFQMARKMLKKFNRDIKAYTSMLRHMVLEEIQLGKPSITLKQVIRRAQQCLKSKDITTVQAQYGKILYQQKKPQQARTVFSIILQKNPKRTDLWSMYVDLEVKHGTIQKAREILEKCLTIKLKRKKIIAILTKYHQLEKKYGTQQSAAQILERAQKIAMQYENQNEQLEQSDKNQ